MSENEISTALHDPNGLSNDIAVVFEEIIAEPNSALTHDAVWNVSKSSFYYGKDGSYLILSTIFGIPLAFFIGVIMAFFSFAFVWFLHPFLKMARMLLDSVHGCWAKFVECSCGSLCYSIGLLCNRVKYSKVENTV